ncbi:cAMP-dependent protein kinase inhibitor gamma [Clupea harengus]|uniref:cAMP-dependent protein kinase inhibitor gamma n=1 Tax=Clupea harengus TaxID=7950 RepID=A0A6P8FF89_CLUHA|nr:cAMP-dependent protein kinase inhibitor gamma [Clupea harengus]XP_031421887.1 cAMP-dependent protein kinase inhibitor gamma [Clupea harengus]
MMDVEASYSEFISGDRTGRRNAVPDITEEAQEVGTSDLSKDMAQMDLKPTEAASTAAPPPEAEASGSQGSQGNNGPS